MDKKTMEQVINGMTDKIESLEDKIEVNKNYKKLWQENTDDYNDLARKRLGDYEKIEELESKYYTLRRELDGIYKVLEMDACDIQALQDKVFNGYTREQNKHINLNNKGGADVK